MGYKLKHTFFTLQNIVIISLGVLTIVVGFIFLGKAPVDGFQTLTLAPILLTIGYVVLLPIGIVLGGSNKQTKGE